MNPVESLMLQHVLPHGVTYLLGLLSDKLSAFYTVSRLERFLWKNKSKDPLIVVHGGYDSLKNIKKETGIGERLFTLENPVDNIEVIAFCALVSKWQCVHKQSIEFKSDLEMKKESSCSFLSLGGPDFNIKSFQQVMPNSFQLKWPAKGESISVAGKSFEKFRSSSEYEYAVVMRQTIAQSHSYILCAGLGANGTLWAGKYLATKWKEIHSKISRFSWCPFVRTPDFLVILRFRRSNYLDATICAAFVCKDKVTRELFSL